MKTTKQLEKIIKDLWESQTVVEISKRIGKPETWVRRHAESQGLPKKSTMEVKHDIPTQVKEDGKNRHSKEEQGILEKKYKTLLKENENLQKLLTVKDGVLDYSPVKIEVRSGSKKSPSVAFALASDWHLEQEVDPNKILYSNKYTLEIAEARAKQFFQNTLDLLQKEQLSQTIETLVLWLGGDFITGNIHTENLKICKLGPTQAICFARDLLISGIQFLLDNTEVNLIIPYNHGNHARITDKVWKSTEEDNSLEYILYDAIAFHYRGNPRVRMVPPTGSVATIEVYGLKIGFVHGHHGFRYMDGVGGLYIPARKYITRKFRNANYYLIVMGHHHQFLQDTYFLCNGSMIGYDQYADSCGFDYSPPMQTFFVISGKWKRRTATYPILFDK